MVMNSCLANTEWRWEFWDAEDGSRCLIIPEQQLCITDTLGMEIKIRYLCSLNCFWFLCMRNTISKGSAPIETAKQTSWFSRDYEKNPLPTVHPGVYQQSWLYFIWGSRAPSICTRQGASVSKQTMRRVMTCKSGQKILGSVSGCKYCFFS